MSSEDPSQGEWAPEDVQDLNETSAVPEPDQAEYFEEHSNGSKHSCSIEETHGNLWSDDAKESDKSESELHYSHESDSSDSKKKSASNATKNPLDEDNNDKSDSDSESESSGITDLMDGKGFFLWYYGMKVFIMFILALMVLGYYGIVIVMSLFMISGLLNWVTLVMVEFMSGQVNILHGIFGIFSQIVNVPYVEFFILYVIASLLQVVDMFPAFGEASVKLIKRDILRATANPGERRALLRTYLIYGMFGVIIVCWVLCSMFLIPDSLGASVWMLILGLIPYVVVIVKLGAFIVPVYKQWWNVLNGRSRTVEQILLADDQMKYSIFKGFKPTSIVTVDDDDHNFLADLIRVGMWVKSLIGSYVKDWFKDIMKVVKDFFIDATTCKNYYPIGELATRIELAQVMEPYPGETILNWVTPCLFVRIFTGLNIVVILWDIYRVCVDYSTAFLIILLFRILFVPLTSYFNVMVIFFFGGHFVDIRALFKKEGETMAPYKYECLGINEPMSPKEQTNYDTKNNGTLKAIMVAIFWLTWVVVIVSSIVSIWRYASMVSGSDRIRGLPDEQTLPDPSWKHGDLFPNLCSKQYYGLSPTDLMGLDIVTYDLARMVRSDEPTAEETFHKEMDYFYNTSEFAEPIYSVHWLDGHKRQLPMAKFDFPSRNLTVFAFRGFESPLETAMIIEMMVAHYVVPFFQDFIILFDYMKSLFIETGVTLAVKLGMSFTTSRVNVAYYTDKAEKIIDEMKSAGELQETVMFTGINVGGVMAKSLSMVLEKQAVSFLSFPVFNDILTNALDLEEDMSVYVTNFFAMNGFASAQEPGTANNIVFPAVSESSSMLEIEGTYDYFCILSQSCARHAYYQEWCDHALKLVRSEFNVQFINERLIHKAEKAGSSVYVTTTTTVTSGTTVTEGTTDSQTN